MYCIYEQVSIKIGCVAIGFDTNKCALPYDIGLYSYSTCTVCISFTDEFLHELYFYKTY
jgi:hypothetical protein